MSWKIFLPDKHSECSIHTVLSKTEIALVALQAKLKQLERLRSEIPPATTWLPILVIHIRSQAKQDKVKDKNFQKLTKIQILKFCKKLYMRHTWSLIKCINMKWIQPELYALESEHGMRDGWTDRWTDGRTDAVKLIYPPTTLLCRGIKITINTVPGNLSTKIQVITVAVDGQEKEECQGINSNSDKRSPFILNQKYQWKKIHPQ